jgi:hypothetical protein
MSRQVFPAGRAVALIENVLQLLASVNDLNPFTQDLDIDLAQDPGRSVANFPAPYHSLIPRQSRRTGVEPPSGNRLALGGMAAISAQCPGEFVESIGFTAGRHGAKSLPDRVIWQSGHAPGK